MSCASGVVSDIFFVRWIEPELDDVARIVDDVRAEAAERGRKLHYVAVIPTDVPVPDDAVRKALSSTVDEVLECCETMHMVIEGKGLRRALVRSVSTSIILLSRHRGRTFAHEDVRDAVLEVVGGDAARAEAIVAEAQSRELLIAPRAAPAGT